MPTTKRSSRGDDHGTRPTTSDSEQAVDQAALDAADEATLEAADRVADQAELAAELTAEQSDVEAMTTAPDLPSPVQAASAHTPAGTTVTLRLPFVSATFTRSAANPGVSGPLGAIAGVGQAAVDAAGSAVAAVPRRNVLFYTGVAALGVAGVVEWPVAALVAASTYVASRSRRREPATTGDQVPAASI